MRIETSRFIMEELHPDDDVINYAQISKRMTWKDTVEMLLDEKKLNDYINKLAKQDLQKFLSGRLQGISSEGVRAKNGSLRARIKKRCNILAYMQQNEKYDQFVEKARERALRYRSQIINECKRQGIDIEKDREIYAKVTNESLKPPIPLTDWHFNIQFLKPDMEKESSQDADVWKEPVEKYIKGGIEANNSEDRNFFFFKIVDKETGKNIGVVRLCSSPKEYLVGYDDQKQPIKEFCVGDPGLFLDPSCQGKHRGSEIYAVALNVLYNFLLKDEDKSKNTVVKCNILNRASRRLQYSIGADITNESMPIDNRYYFTVNSEKILESKCVKKLEREGFDKYTITMDNGVSYDVSLRDGVLSEQAPKEHSPFLESIHNMIAKVRACNDGRSALGVEIPMPAPQMALISVDKPKKMSYHR